MKLEKAANEPAKKIKKNGELTPEQESMMAGDSMLPDSHSQLNEMIAVAAYYRAEQRGFTPGGELADWVHAETELRNNIPQATA
jgi:hypothetical protein